MNEIVLTHAQYMGTVLGAAMVFSCLGVLCGVFHERAVEAERKLARLEKWLDDLEKGGGAA